MGVSRGVARCDRTIGLAHQAANVKKITAGAGVIRQIVDQAEVADDRIASRCAKEPDMIPIAPDGEIADRVALAVKDGDKAICSATDRQPAASSVTVHRKIIGLAVSRIQGEAVLGVARPSASIAIDIKVQVLRQFIADAAHGGTARTVLNRGGAGFVAPACQVVAHVVKHEQAVDLDQAVAIAVSWEALSLRCPRQGAKQDKGPEFKESAPTGIRA